MNPAASFFTVFTPTYNRAHTLERVHRSLLAQTCRDFEWLIVDDGSTDHTAELVRSWIEEARISIRYFQQSNSGKHVAFNRAVRQARGELFVSLDSDDACGPVALERLGAHWASVPPSRREAYAGMLSLGMDLSGNIIGSRFPTGIDDCSTIELSRRFKVIGDKWLCYRTELLRQFPFPEFSGEKFVPEALVWNRIGKNWVTRFVDEALLIVDYQADGLSAQSLRMRQASPRGTLLYYREAAGLAVGISSRLRAAANLWRFAVGSQRYREVLAGLIEHPVVLALGLLPGIALSIKDRHDVRRDDSDPPNPQSRL